MQAGSLPVWLSAEAPKAAAATAQATEADAAPAAGGPVQVAVADPGAAAAAGAPGGAITVSGDGAKPGAALRVGLDLGRLSAVGGNFASRAQLVQLPSCALTTPQLSECQKRTPLPSHYDAAANRLVADVTVPPGPTGAARAMTATQAAAATPMTLGVVSGTSSGAGTYSATSLNPSAGWAAGSASGAFTYQYPIALPPTLGGSAPTVALSYDSASVDGLTSATNSQASWVGSDGWGLGNSFVERSFQPCSRDGMPSSGDDCWAGANLTMSLGSHSGELVPVDSTCDNSSNNLEQSACSWHLKNDDGTKIEYLAGANNGTWNGSYLRVTDTSGTVYYFGASHLPGTDGKASGLGPDAQSAWTVPVFSPNSGDPCYNSSTGQQSWCQMAWRWNLDAVVDVHGNLTTYTYNAEANWYARGGNPTTTNSYTRAGELAEIDYGQRLSDQIAAGGTYQSAAKVVFSSGERCVTSGGCDPSQRTVANGANWPDVPLDQQCDQTTTNCANGAPSFWTSRWLNSIATQVRSNGSYHTVDSYVLNHVFVNVQNPTENTQVPWLASIQRTGQDNLNGQAAVPPLPPVSFSWMLYPNRVPALLTRPDYNRPRLTVVTTETGGTIGVVYQTTGSQRCTSSSLPAQANGDTKDCYNVKWYKPQTTTPIDDWFQRYPVSTVTVDPKLALGDKPQVTTYTYGNPAYHHNDATLADPQTRTWDQFRGYASVTTVTGAANDTSAQTQSTTSYYQGMGGTVTGARSGPISDDDWLAGQTLETDTYTGLNGSLAAYTVHTSSGPLSTADHPRNGLPDLIARYASTTNSAVTKELKSDGVSWRTTTTVGTTDPAHNNRVATSLSTADGTPDVCVVPTYATSTNPMLTSLVAQTFSVSGAGACTANPTAANTVAATRTLFDGQPYRSAGANGDPTSSQVLDHYDAGGTPQFATTTTTGYDAYGRVSSTTDPTATDSAHPAGAVTTTGYAAANPGELPNTVTVTTPAPAGAPDSATGRTRTAVQDIARALPLTVTDPNGQTATEAYDALGRLIAVWPAGRTTAQNASQTFSYAVNGISGSSSVTTNTLHYDDAGYSTSVAIADGLGRTVQTQSTPAFAGYNGRLVTDTFYDASGHVFRSSPGYYENTSAPSTTWFDADTTHVPSSTLTSFDGRGRPVSSEFRAYDVHQSTTTTSYPGVDRTDVTPAAGSGLMPTTTITDARGRPAQFWQYRTTTATGNTGNADVSKYTYTPSGKAATRLDAAGNTWSYGYDLRDRLTTSTDPDAGTTTQSFDGAGRLATTMDARGQTLAFSYDLLGRKTAEYSGTSTTDSTKQLTGYTYDTVTGGKGQLASTTRYVGGTGGAAYTKTIGSYDAAYRPTSVTETVPGADVGLASGTYSYAEQTAYYPITGAVQWANRGGLGDLPSEMLQYSYDSRGLMTSYGQQFGSQWMYDQATGYDAYGRAIRTTANPWGTQVVVTDTFDEPTGRQVSQFVDKQPSQTGAVQQTNYAYNQAGQITAITNIPDNSPGSTDRQCFSYDYLGRLSTAWSDTGTVTMAPQPSVGAIGTCTNSTPTSGAVAPAKTTVGGPAAYWQSYGYDLTGNRTQLVQHDASGNTANDLTTNQTFPAPGTVNNGNGAGGAHALTSSQTVTNGIGNPAGGDQYDAAGNTTKIVDPAGTRNLNGGWVLPSGQSITSNSSRLSMQADGNLVLVSLRTGAVTWSSHTYGHAGAYATMQADGNFVVYDSNRNPLWASGTYPNSGAYLALQDDGNLVVYKNASAPNQNPLWSTQTWNAIDAGNTSVLTWDAEGRLASTTRGGVTTTYVYDADGNLLERSNPTQTILTLGATNDELTYNKNTRATTGTRYFPMPGGLSLVATANTKTYQVADPHGTNTLALDATSLTETRNPVDPFGNPRATTTATNNWAGDHGFVGGTKDTTSELTNLGAREYQASTGRFINPDPLLASNDPQQWNGYAYADNKPTNTSDADGKMIPDDITGLAFGNAQQLQDYHTEHADEVEQDLEQQAESFDKVQAQQGGAPNHVVRNGGTSNVATNCAGPGTQGLSGHDAAVCLSGLYAEAWRSSQNLNGYVTVDVGPGGTLANKVPGASGNKTGNDGAADLILWTSATVYVWEIKPGNDYGKTDGPKDLDRYIQGLTAYFKEFGDTRSVVAGGDLPRGVVNSKQGWQDVWSQDAYPGMRFYGTNKSKRPKEDPFAKPAPAPAPAPAPQPAPAPAPCGGGGPIAAGPCGGMVVPMPGLNGWPFGGLIPGFGGVGAPGLVTI
ncbi:hypothetical protein C7C46_27345 [Streptomyces tateyamensis]|uniref:Bulb-type lectin domain-containing protein n=1 Tax=Streptomyces tateyamensis TaxID=565073 RepID=A0A2V4MVE5_9ACTN|nr:hypothetical protein C7C46_27345 [Streptomyces tateyamensis]